MNSKKYRLRQKVVEKSMKKSFEILLLQMKKMYNIYNYIYITKIDKYLISLKKSLHL